MASFRKVAATSIATAVGLLSTLLFAAAPQPPCCVAPTTILKLDEARWKCLLRKAPDLSKATISPVFVQLTQKFCASDRASMSAPPVTTRAAISTQILNKDQLVCLARLGSKAKPINGEYVFDFSKCSTTGK